MDPVFIIGTERSGTNLLRLMLNAHSNIAVPHPPHIMKFFSPLLPLYGDLKDDRNFRQLIADVCRMVELHPYPWEIRPDRTEVFLKAKERNLLNVYFEVYNQYLGYTGRKRWACKSTFMIEHVEQIRRYYPRASFIYMVRDGRDVAVSAKSSIFNNYHVFYSAQRWKREQEMGLSWLSVLPPDRIMLLKYEDLISDPRSMTKAMCEFLGEEFEEGMLEYHRSAEARKSGGLSVSWENTCRPVMRGNSGKFLRHLEAKEIRLFEAIACDELQRLGYPLTCSREELACIKDEVMRPGPRYAVHELILRLRAEARHLIKDRNSAARLKKLLFMKYLGVVRRLTARYA